MAEGARLTGDRLLVARRADGVNDIASGPIHHEGPRAHRVAGPPRHGVRFTGQDGLVERQRIRLHERAVGRHLIARSEQRQIARHHLSDRDRSGPLIAQHRRAGRHERGETIERTLGAHLLGDADRRVGDEDPQEHRVAPVAERQRRDARDEQDEIEDREDVGDDDAAVRTARGRRPLGRPRAQPHRSLRLGQPAWSARLGGATRDDRPDGRVVHPPTLRRARPRHRAGLRAPLRESPQPSGKGSQPPRPPAARRVTRDATRDRGGAALRPSGRHLHRLSTASAATQTASAAIATAVAARPARPSAWTPMSSRSRASPRMKTSSGSRSTAFSACVT